MLMFLTVFGLVMVVGGFYVSWDKNRERQEKLAKIQRELARREAASAKAENSDTQD